MSKELSLKRSSARAQQRQTTEEMTTSSSMYYTHGVSGAVKRIRSPHNHDVLSGRGGGINAHEGNIRFREWVSTRKNDYNLAPSKAEKARVAREVIEMVWSQSPPGRFLVKDPTTAGGPGWWIELDEEKVMAKTSQALREGAPQIRAAHKDELEEQRLHLKPRRPRKNSPTATQGHTVKEPSLSKGQKIMNTHTQLVEHAVEELKANVERAQSSQEEFALVQRPEKRVRVDYNGYAVRPTDETPPLRPISEPFIEQLDPSVMSPSYASPPRPKPVQRVHSLALSDDGGMEDWFGEEFVNPFEDEADDDRRSLPLPPPRPGVLRDTSVASDLPLPPPRPGVLRDSSVASDLAGLGALTRSEGSVFNLAESNHSGAEPSGVRAKILPGSMSSRYDCDPLSSGWDDRDQATPLDSWWDLDTMSTPVSP